MSDILLDSSGAAASPDVSKGAGALVIDTTTQSFVADVIEESKTRPVLVDFWAPWCGPCRTLSPIIERAVNNAGGKVKLAKMNIDEHPSIAGQLGIQSIPAVIAFVDGQPADGFLGAIPEGEVKAFIDKIAGADGAGTSGIDNLIAEADAMIAAGNPARAAELYSAVREADPENMTAVAGLARVALAAGNIDEARRVLADIPPVKANDAAILAARADIDLAEQTASLGSTGELEERLAKDPDDHAARFDLALQHNAHGDRGAAVDDLLAIVRADKEWDDGKAHKQLLQFFDSWGPKDPATLAGRRRLSSLLFS